MTLGLARTGTTGSHFSGDLFLAISVGNPGAITPGAQSLYGVNRGQFDALRFIPWGFLDPFYEAVVQATEEAVLNVLVTNEEMVGFRGHRTPALPRERVRTILGDRGVIDQAPGVALRVKLRASFARRWAAIRACRSPRSSSRTASRPRP